MCLRENLVADIFMFYNLNQSDIFLLHSGMEPTTCKHGMIAAGRFKKKIILIKYLSSEGVDMCYRHKNTILVKTQFLKNHFWLFAQVQGNNIQ